MQAAETSIRSECEVSLVDHDFISMRQEYLTAAIASYHPTLYRLALRMLRNAQDAEDALQDALLLAFRNLCQFKGKAQMTTWLAAIVVNSARMHIRRRHSRKMLSLHQMEDERLRSAEEAFVDGRPSPEEVYGRSELRRKLQSASERLSPSVRAAFQLVVLNGLSLREAAQTLGVSLSAVKARVFHARRQILQILCGPLGRKAAKRPASHRRYGKTPAVVLHAENYPRQPLNTPIA